MVLLTLYHGNQDVNALENIVENGFDLSKIGSSWGTTYGDGIYFTDNIHVAHDVYSGKNGYIVEAKIEAKTYKLDRDYSVNHKKKIKKIISDIIHTKHYNMIITSSIEPEYVLFDMDCIVSLKLLEIS
jgi:hypothetical protein